MLNEVNNTTSDFELDYDLTGSEIPFFIASTIEDLEKQKSVGELNMHCCYYLTHVRNYFI